LFKSCKIDLNKNHLKTNSLIGLYIISGIVNAKDLKNIFDNVGANELEIQIFSDYLPSSATKTSSYFPAGQMIVSGQHNAFKKANFTIKEIKTECRLSMYPIVHLPTLNGTSEIKEEDKTVHQKSLDLNQDELGKSYELTTELPFASCSTRSNLSNSDQSIVSKYIIKGTIDPLHLSQLHNQHTLSIMIISDSSPTNENTTSHSIKKNNAYLSSYLIIDPATRDSITINLNLRSIDTVCYN
jgi:hypothetical protein